MIITLLKTKLNSCFYKNKSCNCRSSLSQMFFKTGALKNFSNFMEKYLCWSLQACNFIKKSFTQVFSCEIWEIFKNSYPQICSWETQYLRNKIGHYQMKNLIDTYNWDFFSRLYKKRRIVFHMKLLFLIKEFI